MICYGLKDLEDTDYYCPDCKVKFKFVQSDLERRKPPVKYAAYFVFPNSLVIFKFDNTNLSRFFLQEILIPMMSFESGL